MEEAVREKTRMVSMLQVRTKFLEEENSRLQDRIDSITKQKQGLDKLLKEYKLSGKDVHVSSRDHIFIILKAKLSVSWNNNEQSLFTQIRENRRYVSDEANDIWYFPLKGTAC